MTSFIYLCTDILSKSPTKKHKWQPTMWAHNGAKFDAKFVLDYFLNIKKFDLAGATYDSEYKEPTRGDDGNMQWKRKKGGRKNPKVCEVAMSGGRLLQLQVSNVVFRCTYAHHASPLRELPKTFGLDTRQIKKGEFPYPLLKRENWGKIFPTFPALEYFDVDRMSCKRRQEVLKWYNEEAPKDQPWNFDEQLWAYLHSDVDVLCKVMEAYHQKAEEMHLDLWRKDPERLDKVTSPLQSMTAPSWALTMYTTWFMPPNQVAILRKEEAKFIRNSLRGGRTDKRANFIELEHPDDKIEYVDFKSLYPSVQSCEVHDTHFPVGAPTWIRKITPLGETTNQYLIEVMGNKTGFLNISCIPKKYVTHPTLHRVGSYSTSEKSKKLLFELDKKVKQTYAWPEILEAIRCDEIEVTDLHDGIVFEKGTNVFEEYVDFFFKLKESAEEIKEGPERRPGNPGLRQLAKLLLNSLWGKLGQRSNPETEWVSDVVRRDILMEKFDSGKYEMISCILKDDSQVFFKYRIPDNFNNLRKTAPHIAAFVSMWGRVVLHKKLLEPHGMRALYCDTDSAIVYLRHGIDEMQYLGDKLGDLTDEVTKLAPNDFKEPFIHQVVLIAPKTYGMEIRDKLDSEKVYHKVVCKGFEPSFTNAQTLNFDSFKSLVFTQYDLNSFMNGKRSAEDDEYDIPRKLYISGGTSYLLKSSLNANKITPVACFVQRTLNGDYTKGIVHADDPRFISPFSKMKIHPPIGSFLSDRTRHFE